MKRVNASCMHSNTSSTIRLWISPLSPISSKLNTSRSVIFQLQVIDYIKAFRLIKGPNVLNSHIFVWFNMVPRELGCCSHKAKISLNFLKTTDVLHHEM